MSRNSQAPTGPDGRPKTQQVLEQVEEVKGIMHNNIDTMLQNHEKVSAIQDKSETMQANAKQFHKGSKQLKNQMWWKNMKLTLIIVLIVVVLLVIIIVPTVLHFTKK